MITNRTMILGLLLSAAIGTTRAATFTVTSSADTGAGSLRQALADASGAAGADTIVFDQNLNGQVILLASGVVITSDVGGVTIDASSLPQGLYLRGNGLDRLFVNTGTLTLRGLTLTGAAIGPGQGGAAIYSSGTVTVDACTISGNSADYGAALYNDGVATIQSSTLSGNTARIGSVIYNRAGPLQIRHSTITANIATGNYAIYNDGTMQLLHATVAGNRSSPGEAGIYNVAARALTVESSIVGGGNDGTSDLINAGTVTLVGANLAGKAPTDVGGGTTLGSGTMTVADPMLLPLDAYGGRTKTLNPNPAGSPAIDAAVGSTETLDQRGEPRPLDGNLNGSAIADIGAVEFDPCRVVTTAESGPGSIRWAIESARLLSGPNTVRFADTLSGKTIYWTGGQLFLNDPGGLTIDGSALAGGIQIDGGVASQFIYQNSNTPLTLRGLNLLHFYAAFGNAAAILNSGAALTVDRCSLLYNSANGGRGGALLIYGPTSIVNSTIAYNFATAGGGGISVGVGSLTVRHSTIAGNSVDTYYNGGGIESTAPLTLENSMISGNVAPGRSSGDIYTYNTVLTVNGVNSVNALELITTSTAGSGTILNLPPLYEPLAWNGGPTLTLAPATGNPVIDGAIGSPETIDQRGGTRPIDGDGNLSVVADIGAVEIGSCVSPNQPVAGIALAKGALPGDVRLSIPGLTSAHTRTGYQVRRADSLTMSPAIWRVVGTNVQDQDGGTPGTQWTETSGDASPTALWFFQVTALNSACWSEGPF